MLDREDRLTHPLVRESGRLNEVSWDRAYDRVTEVFRRIIDEGGPDALGFLGSARCTNEENYLFQKVARLLGTNNVDNRARICHAGIGAAMRDRLGVDAMTNSLQDLRRADAYLVIGANPAESHPIAFDSYVRPAVNDGATLIHADPRSTATTRLADHHLPLRPGRDAMVVTAMAAAIIEAGLHNEEFVAERTTGFDTYAPHLDDLDFGAVAVSAGIDGAAIRAAAHAFGRAERAAVLVGTGLEPPGHDRSPAADAVLNLLLLTGNVGAPGTGLALLRGRNNEQGAVDAGCRPFSLPGGVPVTDSTGRERVEAEWGMTLPADPGRSELDMLRACGQGIRGIWIFGENPAVSTLDVDVEARLKALDCLVVQDTIRTETVEHADVVLPASLWAEKSGTVTNLDRQVQRVRESRAPPGSARRDRRIIAELGSRLTGRPIDYATARDVFAELSRIAPQYSGLSFTAVSEGGGRWPHPPEADHGRAILHRERFETGQRRAPFVPVPVESPQGDPGLVLIQGTIRAAFQGLGPGQADGRLQIHPRDAAEHGIEDGRVVVVESDSGTARLTASVTRNVRPGTVFAPAGRADAVAGDGPTAVRVRQG